MRWLVRRLFTLCSAVSLLLCVGLCVLWVRSYRLMYFVEWQPEKAQSAVQLFATYGSIGIGTEYRPGAPGEASFAVAKAYDVYAAWSQLPPGETKTAFGFALEWSVAESYVLFPIWSITLVLALLPLLWCVRTVRARQLRRAGLCRTCGYDLRASPDRCPECGAVSFSDSRPSIS